MKRFNIVAGKKYAKADGTQGTKWVKIGSMVEKDNKMFGDLDCIPTGGWFDGSISLFNVDDNKSNNNGGGNNGYNNRQPNNNQQQKPYYQEQQPQASQMQPQQQYNPNGYQK